ncbi:transposase domain-containing protein [Streptomyces sp. NPDC093228]|uniref:transposase domain-containing protein n=1 Tax=Streptomyces sp. NPDC093228 TaxID=3155070 RepID=UPI0029C0392F|nr:MULTISPECIES: transposase domain-containing protein [unclassified Streptomyces]
MKSRPEGVFAPGHLGELTQVVPFEMVDEVLGECGAVQQRQPSTASGNWAMGAGTGTCRSGACSPSQPSGLRVVSEGPEQQQDRRVRSH